MKKKILSNNLQQRQVTHNDRIMILCEAGDVEHAQRVMVPGKASRLLPVSSRRLSPDRFPESPGYRAVCGNASRYDEAFPEFSFVRHTKRRGTYSKPICCVQASYTFGHQVTSGPDVLSIKNPGYALTSVLQDKETKRFFLNIIP